MELFLLVALMWGGVKALDKGWAVAGQRGRAAARDYTASRPVKPGKFGQQVGRNLGKGFHQSVETGRGFWAGVKAGWPEGKQAAYDWRDKRKESLGQRDRDAEIARLDALAEPLLDEAEKADPETLSPRVRDELAKRRAGKATESAAEPIDRSNYGDPDDDPWERAVPVRSESDDSPKPIHISDDGLKGLCGESLIDRGRRKKPLCKDCSRLGGGLGTFRFGRESRPSDEVEHISDDELSGLCGASLIDSNPPDEPICQGCTRLAHPDATTEETDMSAPTQTDQSRTGDTSGEITSYPQLLAALDRIQTDATDDLEDANADKSRAEADAKEVEGMVASLTQLKLDNGSIGAVHELADAANSRKQAAEQRATAAEQRATQAQNARQTIERNYSQLYEAAQSAPAVPEREFTATG